MSMIVGPAAVAVVKYKLGSIHCDAYEDEFEAVCEMLNNGSLGEMVWGDAKHQAALNAVEAHIDEIRRKIAEFNSRPPEDPEAYDGDA